MQETRFSGVRDMLESRYASDDIESIECEGWAPYVEKRDFAARWAETFEFEVSAWSTGCEMISDFCWHKAKNEKGEIDMEQAMTTKISNHIADDEFCREYECGNQPEAIVIDGVVTGILRTDIRKPQARIILNGAARLETGGLSMTWKG